MSSDKQISAVAALCVPRSLLYITAVTLAIKPMALTLQGCPCYTCMHLHSHTADLHAVELTLPFFFPFSLIWARGKATLV